MKLFKQFFSKKTNLSFLLYDSITIHKNVEKEFINISSLFIKNENCVTFTDQKLSFVNYFSKNAFSILILSILKNLKISSEKIQIYGLIMHAIRGIVTAGDNILDDENKGFLKIQMKGGTKLSNIMAVILETAIISNVIDKLNVSDKNILLKKIFDALFVVAQEESVEEDDITKIHHPEYILESIHHFRGGKLLELAFVIPEYVESKMNFIPLKEAIYKIGVSIQILDDITDFKLDYDSRNFNLLISWIIHYKKDKLFSKKDIDKAVKQQEFNIGKIFPNSTQEVIGLAVKYALDGFALLEKNGYPISHNDARLFIRLLFHLRDLDFLWKLAAFN